MRRRAFLFASGALFASRVAAQTPQRVRRIAILDQGTSTVPFGDWDVTRQRLRELGYREGVNLEVTLHWGDGSVERLPTLAATIVAARPDLILSATTPAIQALKQATSTVPIVMTGGADPVGTGLVASLARPGGNVTGFSQMLTDIGVRRLQLLSEMLPGARRFALLGPSGNAGVQAVLRDLQAAAHALGITVRLLEASDPATIGSAFDGLAATPVDGLLVTAILYPNTRQVVELAARHRVPAAYARREIVSAGGLMAYSPDRTPVYRRAADYVHRILQGANPAELPVEQPANIWFGINLKTARAIGLTIPKTLLARADALIE
jgi:putative ABC transport system substrate-binding protein